ncbi:hypothetical protein [Streptomyces sp. NPDC002346]
MFQSVCPRWGRIGEAAGEPCARRLADITEGEAWQHPQQDRGCDRAGGAGGGQGHGDSSVGAVQQPGRRKSGKDVGGGHGRPGVVPGMPVPHLHRGMTGVAPLVGFRLVLAAHPGQGQV